MIKFIDYFFLKIKLILNHIIKDEGGAKWSAFLYTGLYTTATVIAFLCLAGLQYENYVCNLIKQNPLAFNMILGVLILLLLSLRYYKYKSISSIDLSYKSMKVGKRKLIDVLIYLTMVSVPIFAFILFRLYVIS